MYRYRDMYSVDFTDVNSFFEFHTVIKEVLDFPDYYGCNWSAFWDCLTDMIGRPIHIEIIGLDNVERKFGSKFVKTMIDILKDIKHYDGDRYCEEIEIEIVSGQTRVSLL